MAQCQINPVGAAATAADDDVVGNPGSEAVEADIPNSMNNYYHWH